MGNLGKDKRGSKSMTREEKISRLKDILSEINENDNAVCYLTSEDNELIESAIEALEQQSCEDAISREETVRFLANHSNDFEDKKFRMAFKVASSLVENSYNLPSVQPKTENEVES